MQHEKCKSDMGLGHGQVPHPKLTPCQTLHYTVGAKQVELLNKTQQIVPKAGTPQEKNEEGFKIRGQGGSATKPGPNTQIIRLPPLRWHCLSQLPLWVVLPELPALVPEGRVRNKCMQLSHSHCLMSWALPRKRFSGSGSSSCTTFLRADHNAECASDGPLSRRSST